MIARRTVTFGTLALAVVPSLARASSDEAEPALLVEPSLRRRGHELEVELKVRNEGTEPADVLVALGSRPAGQVQAFLQIEGEELELAAVHEIDRRDMMTRAGPRPRFAPIAAGGEVNLGPYRFTLPDDVEQELVAVAGLVDSSLGSVSFRREGLRWQKRDA